MIRIKSASTGLAFVFLAVAPCLGVVLDGSIAGDGYGPPVSVQTVNTGFGDNLSELNAAYVQFDAAKMYLVLTGNIENNFNKLNIFIDSVAGGENVITASTGSGGSNPGNDGWANKYAGFTFDTGFAADYLLINRRGNFGGPRFDFDFNSVGNTGVVEVSSNIFSGADTGANPSVGASGIGVAYDNSNNGGVIGGSGGADPLAAAAVQTGLELAIPLAAIGNPSLGRLICISAHVNGSNHDYLSNQSLGGFAPPQGNLGGDGTGAFTGTVGAINLNNFNGLQYFCVTVVPEPAAMIILGLLACAFARMRRRN